MNIIITKYYWEKIFTDVNKLKYSLKEYHLISSGLLVTLIENNSRDEKIIRYIINNYEIIKD